MSIKNNLKEVSWKLHNFINNFIINQVKLFYTLDLRLLSDPYMDLLYFDRL